MKQLQVTFNADKPLGRLNPQGEVEVPYQPRGTGIAIYLDYQTAKTLQDGVGYLLEGELSLPDGKNMGVFEARKATQLRQEQKTPDPALDGMSYPRNAYFDQLHQGKGSRELMDSFFLRHKDDELVLSAYRQGFDRLALAPPMNRNSQYVAQWEGKGLFNQEELQVLTFAAHCHGEQERKYTGDPYIVHPIEVALRVKELGGSPAMVIAALLHDVVEDTPFPLAHIEQFLRHLGKPTQEVAKVCGMVDDLTDKFTPEAYPNMNRAARKAAESARLGECSGDTKTIKGCDLTANFGSIEANDPSFARVYVREVQSKLHHMDGMDSRVFRGLLDLVTDYHQHNGQPERYIHFTSAQDAQRIAESGKLLPCSYLGTKEEGPVYAVQVGGSLVPGVQQTKTGAASDRSVAVLLNTDKRPDQVFGEEVIWNSRSRQDGVPIRDARIVPAEQAKRLLVNIDGEQAINPLDSTVAQKPVHKASVATVKPTATLPPEPTARQLAQYRVGAMMEGLFVQSGGKSSPVLRMFSTLTPSVENGIGTFLGKGMGPNGPHEIQKVLRSVLGQHQSVTGLTPYMRGLEEKGFGPTKISLAAKPAERKEADGAFWLSLTSLKEGKAVPMSPSERLGAEKKLSTGTKLTV